MLSSLISKFFNDLPSSFGYSIGEKVEGEDYSIWTHYKGYKKNKPEQTCSVFVFEKTQNSISEKSLGFIPFEIARKLAKNQFQKCKSLIHPCILKVYDTLEVTNSYYIITEPCISLYNLAINSRHSFEVLSEDSGESEYEIDFPKDCISGLFEVLNGLKFLHNDGKLLHGSISPLTVYVNSEGSWKLGGFETTTLLSDTSSYYFEDISRQSTAFNIMGWKFLRGSRNPKNLDIWNFGCLVYWSYQVSSNLDSLGTLEASCSQTILNQRRRVIESLGLPYSNGDVLTIENNVIPHWLFEWLSDVLTCLTTNREIDIDNGLNLINNNSPFVELMNQLGNFMLKSPEDKKIFCTQYLPHLLTSIKVHGTNTTNIMIIHRILEKLLMNFAQCVPSVFPLVLTLMESYRDSTSCPKFILRPFNSAVKFLLNQNDRSIRYTLLKNISKYENFLAKSTLLGCIDSILIGFQDSTHIIRETTLQSMTVIIPFLLKEADEKLNPSEKYQTSKTNTSGDFMYSIKEGWKKNSAAILNAFSGNSNSQIAVDKLVCAMFGLSKDPEFIIRSNTVICFAKLMGTLPEQYHPTILNKVYLVTLKDPFPICRKAVVQALLSTIHLYTPMILTQQILPNISVNGFIEGHPEIMEISLALIKNVVDILGPFVKEQAKAKLENDKLKLESENSGPQIGAEPKKHSINIPSNPNSSVQSKNNSSNPISETLNKVQDNVQATAQNKFTFCNNLQTDIYNSQMNQGDIGKCSGNNNNFSGGKEVNWNDFESDLFDFDFVEEQQKVPKDISNSNTNSDGSNSSRNPILGTCVAQKSIKGTLSSSSKISEPFGVPNYIATRRQVMDNLPSIADEQYSEKSNSSNGFPKVEKTAGKRLSTKLDLDSDDFWKEFE
ncbi:SCY1 protein kinase [Cryptosporidium felis]|nr:SCY1 protein kinase [Cryptosporidium felis]